MGLYDRDYYQENEQPSFGSVTTQSVLIAIIVVNVLVFVADFLIGSSRQDRPLAQLLMLSADNLGQPLQWYRIVTNGFVHGDVWHIAFNMLGLYFLGQVVESRYGRGEFLRFYLVSLIFCSLVWLIRQRLTLPTELLPGFRLMGASGAVTAVTMLFVFNYPNVTLRIWGVLPVPAWIVGMFIVVYNLFGNSGTLDESGKSMIAYDVHLAGAAFAALYFYGKLNFGAIGNLWGSIVSMRNRPKLKVHRPESQDAIPAKVQAEADRILDKIHREGQESLTSKERQVLEEYSRAVRKQRQL
jgi:membrane associated rhomboid family serine protease